MDRVLYLRGPEDLDRSGAASRASSNVPDLFELPVDGDVTRSQWVLTAASSEYMVGRFDGASFTPETPKLPGHRGRGFYAAQTFGHDPRGRVVQIGWFQTTTPDMPFNQGMSLPMD